MNKDKHILKSLVLYGKPVQLYINGELSYKTFMGGITTILTLCMGITLLAYFGSEVFLRAEPIINSYYVDYRNGSIINNTNFFFATKVKYFNTTSINIVE